jgi:hypothetical protein
MALLDWVLVFFFIASSLAICTNMVGVFPIGYCQVSFVSWPRWIVDLLRMYMAPGLLSL